MRINQRALVLRVFLFTIFFVEISANEKELNEKDKVAVDNLIKIQTK